MTQTPLSNLPPVTGTKRCPNCGGFDVSVVDCTEYAYTNTQRVLHLRYFCEWCDHTWIEVIPIHENAKVLLPCSKKEVPDGITDLSSPCG